MADIVDDLTDEIATLVHALVRGWEDYLNARVRELNVGITGRQATVLWMTRDPLPIGELAQKVGCDPSSATGIVDRLADKGLVRRVADPRDRRTKRVELTAEGKRLRQRIERRVMAASPSLAGLSRTEKSQLRDLLRKAMVGL